MSENDAANAPGKPTPDDAEGVIPIEPREPDPERPAPGKPRIDSPGLLEDFDEDADFESDPELDRVVQGIPVGGGKSASKSKHPSAKVAAEPEGAGEALCASSAWRVPAAIGAVVSLTAAVLAGVYAGHANWAYVLLTLYWAVLHTATGVGAVIVSGLLLGRPVGSLESAAARMLLAVSLFLVVYSLDIPITNGKLEEVVLAAGAYFGGLIVAFRLQPRDAAVIGGAHFGMALLLWLGSMLSGAIHSGALVAGTPQ